MACVGRPYINRVGVRVVSFRSSDGSYYLEVDPFTMVNWDNFEWIVVSVDTVIGRLMDAGSRLTFWWRCYFTSRLLAGRLLDSLIINPLTRGAWTPHAV